MTPVQAHQEMVEEARRTLKQSDNEHRIKVLIQEPKAMAKQRLMDFAESIDVGYLELMSRAKRFQEHGDYWSQGPKFEGQDVPDTFWDDYTIVTGIPVDPDNRWSFFSCSC